MPAHDPERRDIALTALALNGGNLRRTAEQIDVPLSTLHRWKDEHADRYAEIQNEQAPLIAERVASKSEALALKAIEVEEALLAKVVEGVDDMKGAEAAAAFRNISTGKALQFDKLSNPIRGRNHVRVDERDLDTILNSLGRRIGYDATSTAEEIPSDTQALRDDAGPVNARELTAGDSPSG